jgi:Phosphodiester glycosidase
VIASDLTQESIAPGIDRAAYRMLTTAGPLRVSLVVADPKNASVRFDTVLASDALAGPLETVSSMARRTGAVAGINGDYYAIGVDGAPLGAVVRGGQIVHAAGSRDALAIARDGRVRIGAFDANRVALGDVQTAIGGGPVLLRDGAPVDDPASDNYAERGMRIPASVLARFATGTLAMIVVDGRRPATSIGVNRNELIALLRALGVRDAMLLDSGGSTTLVARVLGDERATIVNTPSDGAERPVADGLFVYSDAPFGPPSRLVVRPARITTLPGVHVPLTSRIVDASGHALGDAHGAWHVRGNAALIGRDGVLHVGTRAGSYVLHAERDGVAADVPVRVVRRAARLSIGPPRANPSRGQLMPLTLEAYDVRGGSVAVNGRVRWSARNARIDARGRLVVAERDAVVTARAGGASTTVTIPVGYHAASFALDRGGVSWEFATVPSGGRGGVVPLAGGVRIRYDFRNLGRAAYARATPPLSAGRLLSIACDVVGDGNGEALRLGFEDAFGARENVTLAPAIDFTGTQRLSAGGPVGLAFPFELRSVYVAGTLAYPAIHAAGSVSVEHCTATVAGSITASSP